MFPPENQVSPVADQLRKVLSDAPWARVGLGLPVVSTVYLPKISHTSGAPYRHVHLKNSRHLQIQTIPNQKKGTQSREYPGHQLAVRQQPCMRPQM